jgi:hypothetical protein
MDRLMDETLKFSQQINKKRPIIEETKARLNNAIVHAIDVEDPPFIESGKYHFG